MARDIMAADPARSRSMQVLAVGGVLGALIGVGAAYLLLQSQERSRKATGAEPPLLTANSALNLGLLVFGLLRQVGEMTRKE